MNYNSEDLDNMTLSEIGGDYRATLDMLFDDEFADYLSGVDNDRLLVENTDEYVQLPENWTDIVHDLADSSLPDWSWQQNVIWVALGCPLTGEAEDAPIEVQIGDGVLDFARRYLYRIAEGYHFYDEFKD